jgi:hypothetical protein
MTKQEVVYWAVFSGVAGGFYSYMLVAYDKFASIPTIGEVKRKLKTEMRLTYMALRILFSILTALIFSLWFMDLALAGQITWSKLSFYLCLLSMGVTTLLDISGTFSGLFKKMLKGGS